MLVGYGSSSDDEAATPATMPEADEVARPKGYESRVDGTSAREGRGSLTSNATGSRLVNGSQEEESKVQVKKRITKKKKKKKKKNWQLPLLEDPVSVDSSSNSGSDVEDPALGSSRSSKRGNHRQLLNSSSLWDEKDLELLDSRKAALDAPEVGPGWRPSQNVASAGILSPFTQTGTDASDDKEPEKDVKEMEKRLKKMLEEGRTIEELSSAQPGGFVHFSGADFSKDGQRRRSALQADESARKLTSSHISGTAQIDGRHISASMKRKNQLVATAYAAQQSEGTASKRGKGVQT